MAECKTAESIRRRLSVRRCIEPASPPAQPALKGYCRRCIAAAMVAQGDSLPRLERLRVAWTLDVLQGRDVVSCSLEDKRAHAIAMHKNSNRPRGIGRWFGVDTPTIYRWFRAESYASKWKCSTAEERQKARTLYETGLTVQGVADVLGVARVTARDWVLRSGGAMRPRGRAHG